MIRGRGSCKSTCMLSIRSVYGRKRPRHRKSTVPAGACSKCNTIDHLVLHNVTMTVRTISSDVRLIRERPLAYLTYKWLLAIQADHRPNNVHHGCFAVGDQEPAGGWADPASSAISLMTYHEIDLCEVCNESLYLLNIIVLLSSLYPLSLNKY